MTSKEKARELVDKYDGFLTYIESKGKAKQCAMASVEEILEINLPILEEDADVFYDYWQQVKHEIEKL
jgi:hypothetical protein